MIDNHDKDVQASLLCFPKSDYDRVRCQRDVWRIVAILGWLTAAVCIYLTAIR